MPVPMTAECTHSAPPVPVSTRASRAAARQTPADRRRNVVTMTPAGRHRLRQLDRLLSGVQDRLLAPLSAAERTDLIALLTRLVTTTRTPDALPGTRQ